MNSAGKFHKVLFKDHRHKSTKILAIIFGALVIFATIPLTVFLTQKSEDITKNPKAATTRDPLKWPFAQNSIWNMPIGSNAVYVPGQLKPHTAWGMTVDPDIIVMQPNAPLRPLYTNANWDINRCADTTFLMNVPMPDGFIIPDATANQTPNNSGAILLPDSTTIIQGNPFSRCSATGPVQFAYKSTSVNIYGDGILGGHGASGLSSVGGTIRLGELVPGSTIHHVMKINLNGPDLSSSAGPGCGAGCRWPAISSDSYCGGYPYGACSYTGSVPALRMGSLVALQPSVNCDNFGLYTAPAKILCQAFQDYGAYVVDLTAWDVFATETEHSPAGNVEAEFKNAWGFDMDAPLSSPWAQDMQKIYQALAVIDNNSTTSIGGGGNPRVALAPPFGSGIPADTTSPTVNITAPINGTNVQGTSVNFAATATDPDDAVSKIELYVNNALVGTDTTGPYNFTWNSTSLANGTYSVVAKGYDSQSPPNIGTSSTISITINNPPPATKVGDLNGDGFVNIFDASTLFANWNSTTTPAYDLNHNGIIDIFDASILFGNWTG